MEYSGLDIHRDWQAEANTDPAMFNKVIWLVPIFQNDHWMLLLIIHPGKDHCVFYHCDSLCNHFNIPHAMEQVATHCVQYVQSLWSFVFPQHCACHQPQRIGIRVVQQDNGYDCGVFVLLNALHAVRNFDVVVQHEKRG